MEAVEFSMLSLDAGQYPAALAKPGGPAFSSSYTEVAGGACEPPRPDCVVACDAFNAELLERYVAVAREVRRYSAGILRLSDTVVMGSCGLVCEPASRVCLTGERLGWSQSGFFDYYLRREFGGELDLERGVVRLPACPEADRRLSTPIVLLCCPGIRVYGHWLIDVVPRLHLLERAGLLRQLPLLVARLPPWALEMLAIWGVDREQLVIVDEGTRVDVDDMLVPTYPRSDCAFFKPLVRQAWKAHAEKLAAAGADQAGGELPDRFFASRRHWSGTRRLADYDGISTALARRGYREVSPETLSLARQAELFARARVTAGEQGSAMHNTVFSKQGSKHLVIMTAGLWNLRHIGVADALGLRLAYVETHPGGEGATVDPGKVLAVLNALERA